MNELNTAARAAHARTVLALTIICLALGADCSRAAAQSAADAGALNAPQSEMRTAIERFTADRDTLERYYTAGASPERAARFQRLYADRLSTLGRTPFDSMSQDGKVDYILLRAYLQREQRQLALDAKKRVEEAPLVPFAGTIVSLEDARRRMEAVNPEKAAATLAALTRAVDAARRAVEESVKPVTTGSTGSVPRLKERRTVVNRAAVTVDALRATLRRWFGFYNGYDPDFTWWAAEPYKDADAALGAYADVLRQRVLGLKSGDETTIVGDPIGRDGLMSELAYAMIPYTPEELIAIANREFAWCEAEMKKASRDMGCGDDWKRALERVKQDHVPPGRQPELIKRLALEAVDFVKQHDLVTVPDMARDDLRMEMMSPQRQLVNPFFLGGEHIIVSYPTDTMTNEQKLMSMRGNNVHFARATVFHELIPGHHLQTWAMARYHPYRELFYTPFWVEGGALYWEMRFWDLGFGKTPEDRVGMLFWRMHRCARIIFSLGFHLGTMTPEQCIDLLVDRVGHERDNAAAEVRRSLNGSYSPLYQCAYMLGGLQIRALRHELVDSGKMTERQFNDAVLHENAIPIEMVRASLTGQKLTRDYTPHWRFYGDAAAEK